MAPASAPTMAYMRSTASTATGSVPASAAALMSEAFCVWGRRRRAWVQQESMEQTSSCGRKLVYCVCVGVDKWKLRWVKGPGVGMGIGAGHAGVGGLNCQVLMCGRAERARCEGTPSGARDERRDSGTEFS